MSYYRRLIEESEKKRILGMHNTLKKNPTTGLLKEALTDFPFCVRYAAGGKIEKRTDGLEFIEVPNGAGKGKNYYWNQDRRVYIYDENLKADDGSIGGYGAFPDGSYVRKYHCKCVNGKCTVQSYSIDEDDRPDECDEKKTCNTQQGNQQGTTPGGQQGGDCSKGPMDLAVSMGLNWKETRQKWIDAKCNGTTPCILGDATTNINLRNALCKGTWKPDGTKGGGQTPGGDGTIPGGDVKLPEIKEIQACFGKVQLDMPFECKGTVMSTTGSAVGGGCIDALVKRFQETPQKMLEVVLCIFAKLQIPDVLIRIIIDYVSKNPQIIIDIINKNPQIIIDIITNNPQLIIDIIKNNPQIIIDIITKNPDIIKQIPIDKLPDILKEIPIEKLPDIIKIPGIPIQLPGGKTIEDILKEFPGSPIGNIPGLLPEKKQKFIEPIFPGKVRD